jgi:hypothetical protein
MLSAADAFKESFRSMTRHVESAVATAMGRGYNSCSVSFFTEQHDPLSLEWIESGLKNAGYSVEKSVSKTSGCTYFQIKW